VLYSIKRGDVEKGKGGGGRGKGGRGHSKDNTSFGGIGMVGNAVITRILPSLPIPWWNRNGGERCDYKNSPPYT